ncbi:MAG: DUF2490 domain-containing protein [Candidatus Omnitrophica bacterium]|nr:DUF2490 domain-containing protein [Candidatus Omnitrophota bacterium]
MYKKIALLSLGFSLLSFCSARAFQNGDFQYWNVETIQVKISDKAKLGIQEEFRFGDNASTWYYNHTDIGIKYKTNKYLETGVFYRQIIEKKSKHWNPEYRPHIDATLQIDLFSFRLKDRNRIAYRIRGNKHGTWSYRNKAYIGLPFDIRNIKFTPYVADEIFIQTDTKGISRNRLYLGMKFPFVEKLTVDVFYLRQATRGAKDKWTDYNIFGTSATISF